MNVYHLLRLMACGVLLFSTYSHAQEKTVFVSWLHENIKQHPDVMSQRAMIDAASAQHRAAKQPLYNPELELEYETTDINTRTAGIRQTFDWSDKQPLLARIANHQLEGERATYQNKRQALASNLMLALAQYQIDLHLDSNARNRQELMSRFQAIAEQRFKAGDLPQIERDLAHLASSEANFQLANQQASLVESRENLKSITGNHTKSLPEFPQPVGMPDIATFEFERHVDQLPVMQQARSQMDVSRLQARLKERERKPDPTIGLRAGKEGKETLTGITFSIPLYVRNNYQGDVDSANALYISQQQQALNLRRQFLARMQSAADRYVINQSVWQAWVDTGKKKLDGQSELLGRLWKSGEISTTDYLVQLKQVLDTQASASEQQGQLWLAWVEWLSASGEINQWLKD